MSCTHLSRSAMLPALLGACWVGAWCAPGAAAGQEMGDPSRLAGLDVVALRATADWDELITTSAGGATRGQFEEALLTGLEAAIRDAEGGPAVDPQSEDVVSCHVDTFYDSGLIVYSARASLLRPGPRDQPVVTWLESWVGSYTTQQLHVIWTLADQCAAAFLADWRVANPPA